MPKHRNHKTKNKDGVVVKSLGVVTINGTDYYTGRWGTPEADQKYHQLMAQHFSGTLEPKPSRREKADALTIDELIGRYTRKRVDGRYPANRRSSEAINIKHALAWVAKLYGSTVAAKFGPRDLKAVQAAMMTTNARTTINRDVVRVRQMFRWAVSEDLYPADRLVALKAVEAVEEGRGARESEPVVPVAADTVARTLPELGPQVRAIVELMLLTAARPGEMCRLRPCDLDRSKPIWEWRLGKHKTRHRGKSRTILFGPKAQAVLLPWLDRDPAAACFQPYEAYPNRTGPKAAVPGRPYNSDSLRAAVTRACDRAGVEPWHPNQLRHAGATAIRKLFGLDAAQHVLGHSKASTTERYAEPDLSKAREAMGEIG